MPNPQIKRKDDGCYVIYIGDGGPNHALAGVREIPGVKCPKCNTDICYAFTEYEDGDLENWYIEKLSVKEGEEWLEEYWPLVDRKTQVDFENKRDAVLNGDRSTYVCRKCTAPSGAHIVFLQYTPRISSV
jgi:hypothetical protein